MKTKTFSGRFGLVLAVLAATSVAAMADVTQSLNVGGRIHRNNSAFGDLPYGDGDVAYGVAYEYRDADALWQVGCDVTPDLTGVDDSDYGGDKTADYAITPQLNLLLVDRMFQGGMGILSSYTRSDDGGDWMDMYWQFILGLTFDLPGPLSLQANAYYVFEKWDNIGDFDVKDVEYGAYLGYKF